MHNILFIDCETFILKELIDPDHNLKINRYLYTEHYRFCKWLLQIGNKNPKRV
jgi:hypothetical protein